jgi:MFS family permease
MHRRILDRLHLPHSEGSGSLIAAMCINAFGAGMFYPFALIYFTGVTSLGVATIGLILTTATLVTLAVTPVTGALVDRLGSRQLVVTSQVLEATGFVLYLTVSSGTTLFVASLLVTSATRMFFASFSTMIAEHAAGGDRDRWYGMVGVTQSLAASISGFLASLVIASIGQPGFRTVIALNACCLLGSAVMLRRVPANRRTDDSASADGGYRSVLADGAFVRIVASNALFVLCSMLPGIGLALYITDGLHAPLWTVGVLGIVQTGLVIGFQMRVLRVVEGIRRTRVMQFAGGVWVAACLLFAGAGLLPDLVLVPYVILSVALFTFAQLLYVPTAQSLAASVGPPALQGRYVATYELSWGLARAMSPALFGITFDLTPAAPWLAMSVIVLCAMVVLRSAETRIDTSVNHPLSVRPAP